MWKNWNCCSLSRTCCVVRLLATVGTAMQVAAFLGEIVRTALHCPLFLSWSSAPHELHLLQCPSTWFLLFSPTLVQTWLFPWTLNHRTLTCLLLQPRSTGLFVPASMCVWPPQLELWEEESQVCRVWRQTCSDMVEGMWRKRRLKQRRGGNGHDLHHKHFDGYFITG